MSPDPMNSGAISPDGQRSRAPLSVAPMMDRTDRHFRRFLRGITKHTVLYTEMVHVDTILLGGRLEDLDFDDCERPLVLQLGGAADDKLAQCARLAEERGFAAVNLNVGCPSDRVQQGRFGACLMDTPEVVARAVEAMIAAVEIPVTVKHRIGIDDRDRFEDMIRFVTPVAAAGCAHFIVHARKAWLSGLSPHQNRTVPPLRHEDVYRLKEELPGLHIETNGGVTSLDQVEQHLDHVDGVMMGRRAYDDPIVLAEADRRLFGSKTPVPTREQALESYLVYVEEQLSAGQPLSRLVQHIHGLFTGLRGARRWRRHLADNVRRPGAGPEVVQEAAKLVNPHQ